MKKFLLYIMVVAGMVSMQSCLHDDKDLFDDSAANRLEQATEETKQILESSESGWALQYYLYDEYTGGGLTYLVKFKDGKADVSVDLADPSQVSRSSYDVIKDQGPVLTFNTYNELMHAFANPTTDGETNGGDFEFVVMNVTNDEIDLKGRTTGNKMKLIRLPEGTNWEDYLNSIMDFESNMFSSYNLIEDGKKQGVVTFNPDARQLEYVSGDTVDVTYPYCVTPNGIVMPKSLVANACSFTQAAGEVNLTASDATDGKSVSLEPFFTPDYILKVVGSVSLNDDAQSVQTKIKEANVFSYTTDADWLTVSADENGLTIKTTANNEGHPRVATVKVANENGEDEFTVTQLEFAKDVVGTYALSYYDAEGTPAYQMFTVTSPDAIDVPVTIGNTTLHSTLTWNAETASFDWSSFQYMGNYQLKSGICYAYNIFYTVSSSYWSGLSNSIIYSAPISYDEEDGTYAIFEGTIAGEDIDKVYVMACNANPPTATSGFLGYLEILQVPALVKIEDSDGTRSVAAKSAKRNNMLKMLRPAPSVLQSNPKTAKKLIK